MRKAMLVMPEKICNYLEQEAFLFPFDSTKDELQFRWKEKKKKKEKIEK